VSQTGGISRVRTAWGTAAAIVAGETTATEEVSAALARIDERNGEINAFTYRCDEAALESAAAIDGRLQRGAPVGPLAGVPVSVKDHIWLAGAPATNGSRALADFVPTRSAVCVERLVAAGAVVVGKTNNPEFCYRGVTVNDLYGLTRNPQDPSRTAGGSSGGAAASVAAGIVPLALGTDGGGSIRIPSAFCGTAGLKPTFGLIPKMPGFRGWPTLSVDGPIAASVRDLALATTVMAGPAPADPLSYPPPWAGLPETPRSLDVWAGLTVAVSMDLGHADVDPDVRARFRETIDLISDAGAKVIERHPETADPGPLWDAIALPEGFASEGPVWAATPQLVGVDAAATIIAGAGATAQDYLEGQHRRAAFTEAWLEFFGGVDVILTPTMPTVAFPVGRLAPESIDGKPVPDTFDGWCSLALAANLAGLPAASVPIGAGAGGLPVGLQIMGPRWGEPTVLLVAAAVESLLGE
jgi:Asp-tRNA(Asn)/Glu-tRNA(Gln) amidotransferase A subunit family amidase